MKRQSSPEHISTVRGAQATPIFTSLLSTKQQQQLDWSDTSSAYLVYHIGTQEVRSLVSATSESSVSTRSSKPGRKPSTEKAKVSQR